jgi:hypothetical protein
MTKPHIRSHMSWAPRETLDPARIKRRRHHSVASFLKALPRSLFVSQKSQMESQPACYYSERGLRGRKVHDGRSFIDGVFFQSGRILPPTRRLSRHLWVRCTLVCAFLESELFYRGLLLWAWRGFGTLCPTSLPFGRRRCKVVWCWVLVVAILGVVSAV